MWIDEGLILAWRKTDDYRTSSCSRDDYQIGTTNTRLLPSPPGESQWLKRNNICSPVQLTFPSMKNCVGWKVNTINSLLNPTWQQLTDQKLYTAFTTNLFIIHCYFFLIFLLNKDNNWWQVPIFLLRADAAHL